MKYLLPYKYRKFGAFSAPIGFALWLCMQFGLVTKLLTFLFGQKLNVQNLGWYHYANVFVAVIGFFGFLFGLYFLIFSKEKVEDEMIQKTRLESFLFAAFLQLVYIILGFVIMIIYKEPHDNGLMVFFVIAIFLFWISFICKFHFALKIKHN